MEKVIEKVTETEDAAPVKQRQIRCVKKQGCFGAEVLRGSEQDLVQGPRNGN